MRDIRGCFAGDGRTHFDNIGAHMLFGNNGVCEGRVSYTVVPLLLAVFNDTKALSAINLVQLYSYYSRVYTQIDLQSRQADQHEIDNVNFRHIRNNDRGLFDKPLWNIDEPADVFGYAFGISALPCVDEG